MGKQESILEVLEPQFFEFFEFKNLLTFSKFQ